MIKPLALALAATLTLPVAAAQEFDLNSQRSEIREYNAVPGHKLDHSTGPVINPVPHSISYSPQTGTVNTAAGFRFSGRVKPLKQAMEFLPQATDKKAAVKLHVDFGAKAAAKAGVKAVSGAYALSVDPAKGVSITGYDETGAFYGLQTLRQMLEHAPVLTAVSVNDWPDLPYRGVVEGFYGTPWSHQARLSLIDFYGRHKMNNYIYGPKDDPYHSSPHWRKPYPAEQAAQIAELVDACRRNHVDFVWAIHPGKDIRWDKADYDSLVNKLEMMYDLGVRDFALFFDDIEGIGTDPSRQAALVNDLTRDFVHRKGDVGNLMICPTDYSQLWAKPGENGPLAIYGRELNKDAEVFWTGAVVCSDLTPATMEFVNSRIKRPALYWWNFPVTDYCRNILLQGPVYGLDTTVTVNEVAGIESNPMEHGEASKLALYGVADWSWNTPAYNAMDNWERGLVELAGPAAPAYRTFAIHSTDTETGYRRDESWETETFSFDQYTPEQFEALRRDFADVAAAPALLEQNMANKALLAELTPWMEEFGKLGHRGLSTLELIKTYEAGNDSLFWCAWTANLMSQADRDAYQAHKSGTMKLQPFYENAMDQMLARFYTRVSGGVVPATYRAVGSYPNLSTILPKQMLDGNMATFYTSAQSQGEGDWIGLDLGTVRPLHSVEIHQGRNSVDDVDYFDHAILEASTDGQSWQPLTGEMLQTYDVMWRAADTDSLTARYVRLRRLPSERKNWASVRTFSVNPPSAEQVGLNIVCADPKAALAAFDTDPASVYPLQGGSFTFDRKNGTDTLTMMAADLAAPLYLTELDADGRVLATAAITSPWTRISLQPATARIKLAGTARIHEILMQ